jgi:hypothetical protein
VSTDRELLELAAKAAGICGRWARRRFGNASDWSEYFVVGPRVGKVWNPLTDDGDALRLAVRLQLTVCNEHLTAGAAYCTKGLDWSGPTEDARFPQVQEVVDGDYAVTRRAIVRAAAEIARHSTK